jgi:hypothetical protein
MSVGTLSFAKHSCVSPSRSCLFLHWNNRNRMRPPAGRQHLSSRQGAWPWCSSLPQGHHFTRWSTASLSCVCFLSPSFLSSTYMMSFLWLLPCYLLQNTVLIQKSPQLPCTYPISVLILLVTYLWRPWSFSISSQAFVALYRDYILPLSSESFYDSAEGFSQACLDCLENNVAPLCHWHSTQFMLFVWLLPPASISYM